MAEVPRPGWKADFWMESRNGFGIAVGDFISPDADARGAVAELLSSPEGIKLNARNLVADIDIVDKPHIPETVVGRRVFSLPGDFHLQAFIDGQIDHDGRGVIVPASRLSAGVPQGGPAYAIVGGVFT
jgi:hypothetical protein